ncbi:thioesterase [Streptomyces sp. NA02950]|uniref:thioesterase II family protein n=1 Tax=Streptomyces sp. NA02950 TaxID=2742137 RepID=UPI0015901FCA|nr:alpha/beta fold hydrolase [Streptomyces sp. NA02950]QKV90517.1 thioesterase [Streptomyces sp. NA02950]
MTSPHVGAAHAAQEPSAASPRQPTARLFVLPHAGGSAGYYRGWSRWLPGTVELVPLDLPGHFTRMREPLLTEWPHLADDLADQVGARTTGPYVLAGHSLGALLAYEVARIQEARGTPPRLLAVSGRNGPAAGLSHRPIHQLSDSRFLEALERLGGTPGPVLGERDLMRLYLPLLRADLRLAETYTRTPGPPLSTPVAAFGGRRDRLTDTAGLVAWSRETTGTFDLTVVEGGHFFHDGPSFTEAVRARLHRLGLGDERQVTAANGILTETGPRSGLELDYSPPVEFISERISLTAPDAAIASGTR